MAVVAVVVDNTVVVVGLRIVAVHRTEAEHRIAAEHRIVRLDSLSRHCHRLVLHTTVDIVSC